MCSFIYNHSAKTRWSITPTTSRHGGRVVIAPAASPAVLFGMIMAAVLRIIFAVFATYLLNVPGLLFVGGVLLVWVCWRL